MPYIFITNLKRKTEFLIILDPLDPNPYLKYQQEHHQHLDAEVDLVA